MDNAALSVPTLSKQVALYDLKHYDNSRLQHSPITPALMLRYRVLPLDWDKTTLQLGMSNTHDEKTLQALRFQTGLQIRPVNVAKELLDKIIQTHCQPKILHSRLEIALTNIEPTEEIANEQQDEPVTEFLNQLIQDAIDKDSSDIHIEPYEMHYRIRFRQDGKLQEVTTIPTNLALRITTRLKIMANLNIAERRLPQDGRIQWRQEGKIDIRVNTCPTIFGEKIVLRILHAKAANLSMDALGLTSIQKQLFLASLSRPQGLILVTGPTGSGKTISLYTALHHLNQTERNISSVEDPVEIELPGINQINIHPRIGLDFSTALRTFLRQDPDVIMVGEIRDQETAEIALQASQTGHLVLSTLHTNSAIETISRLQSFGIADYHIIHGITLIIAQRLVRKLCVYCKKPDTLSLQLHAYQAVGCERCYQGYLGRIGIFELLPMTEKLAQLIINHASMSKIIQHLQKENWQSLWDIGLEKVRAGITSHAEIHRAVDKRLLSL